MKAKTQNFIVILVLFLTSCGMSTNFNRQKFTRLKQLEETTETVKEQPEKVVIPSIAYTAFEEGPQSPVQFIQETGFDTPENPDVVIALQELPQMIVVEEQTIQQTAEDDKAPLEQLVVPRKELSPTEEFDLLAAVAAMMGLLGVLFFSMSIFAENPLMLIICTVTWPLIMLGLFVVSLVTVIRSKKIEEEKRTKKFKQKKFGIWALGIVALLSLGIFTVYQLVNL